MNYILIVSFSFSIVIAAVIAIVKFKKIEETFRPFIYCIWLASLNEGVSFVLTSFHLNTAPTNNIYVLAEALLIGWQFQKWELFSFYKHAFSLYVLLILLGWLADYFPFYKLQIINSGFRILSSFLIVLMSIYLNNKLVYDYNRKLLGSPLFIFGAGFIIYFTFRIILEAFLWYGLFINTGFYKDLFVILSCINLLTNLLYACALLCIPKKIYYIEPY